MKALGFALLGAALALAAVFLPARFRDTVTMTDVIGGNEQVITVDPGDGREPVPLPNPAVHQGETTEPRTETLTVKLDVDGKTEVKTVLPKGKMLLYTWKSEGGPVYTDFHGHDPALGNKFWVRYSEVETAGASGSLVAPFSGEHGWFWRNDGDAPVTITLNVSGYFEKTVDYGALK